MTGRSRNPQARREYVDAVTGTRTRPAVPGSRRSGRLITRVRPRADAPFEVLEVDPEDLDSARDTFGIDASATSSLRERARAKASRAQAKPMHRNAELDLGRAGATTTFASGRAAADAFMRNNTAIFDSPLFEASDLVDATRDFMDRIEVRSGNRFVRLSATPRGEEILSGSGRGHVSVAREMLTYLMGQAGRARRWRDVPWALVDGYIDEIGRVMQEEAKRQGRAAPAGGVEWYPLSSGVYSPEEVVAIAVNELGEAKARKLAAWLNSQSLYDLSDRLEAVVKPPKGSAGKAARRALRCLSKSDRATVRRRVREIREWAAFPDDTPAWACVATRETQTTAVPVCMYPALEEEIRRLIAACEDGYDPNWPEREHARQCAEGTVDESGLPPQPCGDQELPPEPDDLAPPEDLDLPWDNPAQPLHELMSDVRGTNRRFAEYVLETFERDRVVMVDGHRPGLRAALTRSARPGARYQVTEFDGDTPTGHSEANSFADATRYLWDAAGEETRRVFGPKRNPEERWIAKRKTSDGKTIYLWPDGVLTWSLGEYVKGSPHPRTAEQKSKALSAGWMVLGDVEIYDADEVPDLIEAARWATERGLDVGKMRERLHRRSPLRPVWTVIEADRDGKPLIRSWVLPRIAWPGLAVWNDRGKYSVWTQIGRTGTYKPTGVSFTNLTDLQKYLDETRQDKPTKRRNPERASALTRRIARL